MVEFQRKPLQQLLRVITHLFDQAQRFAIGADQDVLAVVQVQTVDFDAARASAELSGGFEYGDIDALGCQFDRCRQSGPAAADDRDLQPLIQVRQAIHNLRIGVSDVRWLSTRQPSFLISSSSVR